MHKSYKIYLNFVIKCNYILKMPNKTKRKEGTKGHGEVYKKSEKRHHDYYLKPNFNPFLDKCHL